MYPKNNVINDKIIWFTIFTKMTTILSDNVLIKIQKQRNKDKVLESMLFFKAVYY